MEGPWQAWQARARSVGPALREGAPQEARQPHIPCLRSEAVDSMLPPHLMQRDGTFDGTYVDCTFGRGGHTREILSRLSPSARLFAFDVDGEAVAVARKLELQDSRFRIIHRPFGDIADAIPEGQLNGVLVDLGVSSPQLDDQHRGFHLTGFAPPDMRMNQEHGLPAAEWLQGVTAEELAWVIHSYGEDDDALLSERIAETILHRQREIGGRISSTRWLSDTVKQAKGGQDESNMHPAKLTLQAIRVFLNHEMEQLDRVMSGAMARLAENGRCSVISFKKKEANAIRKFVREHEEPPEYLIDKLTLPRLCELFPLIATEKDFSVRQLGAPVKPSDDELQRNRRARSSAVHILQKLPRHHPCVGRVPGVREHEERFREPRLHPTFAGASSAAGIEAATLHPACAPAGSGPAAEQMRGSEPGRCLIWARECRERRADAAAARSLPRVSLVAPPRSPERAEASAAPRPAAGADCLAALRSRARDRQPCDEHLTTDAGEGASMRIPAVQTDQAAGVVVDAAARAHADFTSGVEGYLLLSRNDLVQVKYKGVQGDEAGWNYGFKPDGSHGWFPANCVSSPMPAQAG